MRVYLDNNILVDTEDGIYGIKDFMNVPHAEYYYSNAHISELLNGVDKSIVGLKEKRLKTIESICGSKYLFQDTPSRIRLALCKPEQAYENVVNGGFLRGYINQLVNYFTPNRQGILEELNWDPKEVGNYLPQEIFDAIEEKFQTSYHYGIREYLLMTEAYTQSTIYATLFNLLDMVSYRKDKNNVARLYDSSHAYYAQKCAILVSNDARMRIKAEAVYHYVNINTKVMDAQSYLFGTNQ